ncbi:Serine/threonine-protein kinase SRPK [Pseudocercospora fuligena]|uniref:non-specific serine/threonine protein kinase n=1 Tax=Pseudocercospora fuligena TaxID=685502 RepID=A0A8H6VDL3_9PEZI|nr:Serine/threonine-protein kinase SRPK [Pseudocercospora fuligena]
MVVRLLALACVRPSQAVAKALLRPRLTSLSSRSALRMSTMSTNITSSDMPQIDPGFLVEEETVKGYNAEHYYPVVLGEVLKDRYRTVGKLGFGSASTVWLCRDETASDKYVALKVYINKSKVHRELPIYSHLNALKSKHPGQQYVRRMLDSFEVEGPHGKHICLVHQPFGMNFDQLKDLCPNELFTPALIRESFRDILDGLEYLHKEAKVIHTDLQPSNLLLGVLDQTVFAKYEQQQIHDPVPRKELPDRTIYTSRSVPLTKGRPAISDLSEARFGDAEHSDLIMPNVYRAPEVILDVPWSYPVDRWAFAMVIWDLFEPNRLFNPKDEVGNYSEEHHLASMVALLGPPPLELLQMSKRSQKYWNEDGTWKGKVSIPDDSLESLEKRLDGEEKETFLRFIKKMLQWHPKDRCDWEDILMDEWLLADLIKNGTIDLKDEER